MSHPVLIISHSMGLSLSGNESGEVLGFIVEESHSLLSVMARQAFATHRPFRAIIMDAEGSPMLWVGAVLNLHVNVGHLCFRPAPQTLRMDQF